MGVGVVAQRFCAVTRIASVIFSDRRNRLQYLIETDPDVIVLVRGPCRYGALRLMILHFKLKCCACVPAVVAGVLCARGLCRLAAPVACSDPAGGTSVIGTTVYDQAENDNNTSMAVQQPPT